MDIKSKIDAAIERYGKRHFTRFLKKDDEFTKFIQNNSLPSLPFIEQISLLYHTTSHLCLKGNKKKFISIDKGFGFCGKTGVCECARNAVSAKVSETKSKYSKEEKKLINNKRINTNLEKYGVINTGQLDVAKKAHKEFYSLPENVNNAMSLYTETMIKKYGVKNGFNTEKANWHRENKNPFKNPEVIQKGIKIRQERAREGVYLRDSYDKIKTFILNEFNVDFTTPKNEYIGVSNNVYYNFKCLSCNHEFSTWLDNGHDPICKICNPTLISYISKEEKELADWVESLGLLVDRHNKSLINPYELDIIIHAKKIAIEYCGLYWHSSFGGGKSNDYHKNKMKLVNEKGYKLITIFSDEWNLQKDKVKNILKHILGISDEKIDARKCNVFKLTLQEEKEFLNKHHLQNWVSSKIAYGLKYSNEIVGLMSFGSNRMALNRKNINGEWEIRRLVFSKNVRGGPNKLISYFEKKHNPTKMWSDTDLRWSEGGIYKIMGMYEYSESEANYWYVKNYSERIHRLNLTKKKLISLGFDSTKTETEITQELGYDRIWDCGIKRFVKEY